MSPDKTRRPIRLYKVIFFSFSASSSCNHSTRYECIDAATKVCPLGFVDTDDGCQGFQKCCQKTFTRGECASKKTETALMINAYDNKHNLCIWCKNVTREFPGRGGILPIKVYSQELSYAMCTSPNFLSVVEQQSISAHRAIPLGLYLIF